MPAALPAKARLRATLPRTCLEASMLGQLVKRGECLCTSHERGRSLEEKIQFRKLVGEGSYKKRGRGEKDDGGERGVFRHFGGKHTDVTEQARWMGRWIHLLVAQLQALMWGLSAALGGIQPVTVEAKIILSSLSS